MKKQLTLLTVLLTVLMCGMPAIAKNWSSYRIMLDPGHGGSDPGAQGPSAPHEAELALRCANAIAERLGAVSCNYKLTRTGNYDVSLSARKNASIAYDPWIFCSIHLNSAGVNTAVGTETWYYWTTGNSYALAQKVQAQLVANLGRANRGVKNEAWTVITGSSSIPAILTEGLFVNNPTEWGMIKSNDKAGFKGWVNGHLKGFRDHLNTFEGGALDDPTNLNTPEIKVSTNNVSFTCGKDEHPYQDITVTGKNLSGNISIWSDNSDEFSVSTGSLGSGGGSFRITFQATGWYHHKAQNVHVKCGNVEQVIYCSGTVTGDHLGNLSEGWNLSKQRGSNWNKGYDAANIRNFAYLKGKLYCVYNHNEILVLNAQTGEKIKSLNTNGVDGGTLKLCDVTVCSDKILACNLAVAGNGDHLRIYQWDNDDAAPSCILDTQDFQGAPRIGDAMEVVGNVGTDAWYAFANDDNSTSRIVEYHQTGSTWTPKYTKVLKGDGTRLPTGTTSRAYPKGSGWWVDGNQCDPCWVVWDDSKGGAVFVTSVYVEGTHAGGANHHEFYYHGHKYAANMVFRGSDAWTSAKLRILHDPNGNFRPVERIQEMPSDGLGTDKNTNGTGDCIINTDEVNFVEGWVLSTNQGMAYFKYGNPPVTASPVISFSEKDVDLRAKVGEPTKKTLYVNGTNLRGGIDIAVAGCPEGKESCARYSVSPTHLDGPGEVTLTYTPTEYDYDWVWLSATSEGAETAWIDIHGRGYKDPSITVEGDPAFTTYLGEETTRNFNVTALDMKGWLTSGIWGDNSDQFSQYNSWGLTDNTTVYFQNSRAQWGNVYVWIWDKTDGTNYTGGTWPGTKLEPNAEGMCSFTFNPADKSHDYGIVFSDGNATQTDDGTVVNGATYASATGTIADRVKDGINGKIVKMPLMAWINGTMTITHKPTEVGYKESNYFVSTEGIAHNYDVVLKGTCIKPSVWFTERDIDLRGLVGTPVTRKFGVTGENLRGGIDLWIAGGQHNDADVSKYSLSPTHLDGPGEVTLTYTPTDYDYNWIWITAATPGTDNAWIDIHGRGYKNPTITVEGDNNFGTSVGETNTHNFTVNAYDLKSWLGSGLWGDNTGEFSIYNSWGLTDNTTIHFQNSRTKWDNVYAHIWMNGDPWQNITGDWPGVKLTPDANGDCHYTFNPTKRDLDYAVSFSNGDGTISDDAIVINGAWYAAPTGAIAERAKNGINGTTVKMPLMAWLNGTVTVTHKPTKTGYYESNFYVATPGTNNYDVLLKGYGQTGAEDLAAYGMKVYYSQGNVVVRGAEASSIRVHSISGAMVAYADHANECSVADIPSGSYIVTVTAVDGSVRRVKLRF